MPDTPGAGRLDAQTLAAYIDGQLPPAERAQVEAEIAADPDSYEWLVETVKALQDDDPAVPAPQPLPAPEPVPVPVGKVVPFYRRRTVQGAGALFLAAAAALVLMVRTTVTPNAHLEQLVAAVGNERYIEARLTGGFAFGLRRPVMRGAGDLSQHNLQLLAAAGAAEKAAAEDRSAANLHAWGIAQTLLGDADGAVQTLTAAQRLAPRDATVPSDLGAALLARAEQTGADADVSAAVAAYAQALAIDSTLPEALFGHALALERQGGRDAAREAWRRYLQADSTSAWAADARARLQRLEVR